MIDESVAIRSSSSTGSVDSDSEEVINFGIQPLVRTLEYFQELRGQHLSIPCHTLGVAAPDVFKCSVEEVRTRNAAASVLGWFEELLDLTLLSLSKSLSSGRHTSINHSPMSRHIPLVWMTSSVLLNAPPIQA